MEKRSSQNCLNLSLKPKKENSYFSLKVIFNRKCPKCKKNNLEVVQQKNIFSENWFDIGFYCKGCKLKKKAKNMLTP